jgi:hypothetical protein
MAVGQKRGSRPAGAESPAVRGEDGQPVAASVDDLLARVAHGDAEAFAAVYDQVAGAVHGLMSRIVEDQSRAEQLTADALVEVWRSASQFRPAWGKVADRAGVPLERLREGLPGAGQPPGTAGGSAEGIAPQRARPGRRAGLPRTRGKEGHRA